MLRLLSAVAPGFSPAKLGLLVACLWSVAVGAEPPSRIVSTSPSITETLFALGLGDRVVGVSSFCRYPVEATKLPKVGTFLKPDVELIVRLRPDLVIVHPGPSGAERRLATLNVPFVVVDRGTLASVYSTIRTVGSAAAVNERADALIEQIERRFDRVRAAVRSRTPTRVLLIVGRRAGALADIIAVGRGSYLNDLLTIAGGENVLASDSLVEYPRISMETIVRLAPEVIVDAGDMEDTAYDRATRQAITEGLWARQRLLADGTRVHAVISDAFVLPGPRVVEVVEAFAGWFHGVTPAFARERSGGELRRGRP